MAIPNNSHHNRFNLSVQISSGMNSLPHEFSFMANILKFERTNHICDGTIISTMLVITAAHCVERKNGNYLNYLVVAGQHNSIVDKNVEQKRKISKIYIHPNYKPGNKKNSPFDIAVIVLNEPLKFNQNVNCINPLTNALNASLGTFGTIVGWGEVGRDKTSPLLKKAHIELMNRKMCNSFLSLIPGNGFFNMYDSIICSSKNSKSICSGDSGGPLICKNNFGHNSLCGISAFNPDSCGQGSEVESYFTSVPYFYSWIKHYPMSDMEILRRNGESGDSTVTCGDKKFLCNNKNQIPLLYHCDNENDCGDESDEIGCFPCGDNEFKGKNDKCVSEEKASNEDAFFSENGTLLISDYKQICGRRFYPTSRIVGGKEATYGKWPWQVSLRQWRNSTYLHKCGAALLNENWAITAAHCVEKVPPTDLLLRIGEFDLSEDREPYGYVERRVQVVETHPQFDARTYDLAFLQFYEPVVFQPNIVPICVPNRDEDFLEKTAYVTGWGRLYEDGPLPSRLQEVPVPIITNEECEQMYRKAGYIEHIPNIFICAGWRAGGKDTCHGDTGAPLSINRADDNRWVLGGVMSWGIGCAKPNQPSLFTRISEFRDWINQILKF